MAYAIPKPPVKAMPPKPKKPAVKKTAAPMPLHKKIASDMLAGC